jgi:hypothetical protein
MKIHVLAHTRSLQEMKNNAGSKSITRLGNSNDTPAEWHPPGIMLCALAVQLSRLHRLLLVLGKPLQCC